MGKDSTDGNAGADPKAKFREALERKRGNQADRAAAAEAHGDSKIHGEHAAAATKRTFRRKAGG
ncbi:MAG: hypothetical protein QOK11_609 [Pseudonocardiales bacterium]|jgi:hypothetical protein|nr:hypothetical protein [Pseudonocardiales bacterium]MDT4943928.1 hypothetical protein [Pseudonocardiales bacterium]